MRDEGKTKAQLISELEELRTRIAALEASKVESKPAEAELLESEEQYRSFVQHFRGIAFRGNIDFTPVFFHGQLRQSLAIQRLILL